MALYRCTSGSGGGMTETVLWTNPSPSSDFSTTSIDLGETILNYDLLRVKVRANKVSGADQRDYFFSTDSLYNSGGNTGITFYLGAAQSGEFHVRRIWVLSESPSIIRMSSGASDLRGPDWGTSSRYAYPIEIAGVKIS